MTAATIKPTAIDAFVHVEAIKVVGRHRWDLGDLRPLADSIADVGLLNPITLTRDGRLIAGQRRLEACRLLGWAEVPVRFADSLTDAVQLLHAERDENVCRKEMLPSELAALGDALYEIEAERAKERQGTRTDLGHEPSSLQGGKSRETTEVVGEALGMSRSTYADLRCAYNTAADTERPEAEREVARAALAEMDHGRGIQPAANEMRRKLRAKREAAEAVAAVVESEPEGASWVPAPSDKGPKPSQRRRELIREMAPSGMTSTQIGERLGLSPETVRLYARQDGVEIHADKVLGRTHKRIDSNRIIRETVQDLENTEMSLSLVRFDELDASQIANWTASLSKSIRMLNRLNKQLKEMVQ